MNTLYIIGGAPGSGKSTLANIIKDAHNQHNVVHYEADMYFMVDGCYKFDKSLIKNAHEWCQNKVLQAMLRYYPTVIVSNTFTKAWERKPYLDMAKEHGYEVQYIHCTANYGNIHGVSDEVVTRMRVNYEPFYPATEL